MKTSALTAVSLEFETAMVATEKRVKSSVCGRTKGLPSCQPVTATVGRGLTGPAPDSIISGGLNEGFDRTLDGVVNVEHCNELCYRKLFAELLGEIGKLEARTLVLCGCIA